MDSDALAVEAVQEFLLEKDVPVPAPSTSIIPALISLDEPWSSAASGLEIIRLGAEAQNEFLSEREVLRRSRLPRRVARALGIRPRRAALAAALLCLVVVRGTAPVPDMRPAAADDTGDSIRASSASDAATSPSLGAFGAALDPNGDDAGSGPSDAVTAEAVVAGMAVDGAVAPESAAAARAASVRTAAAAESTLAPPLLRLASRPAETLTRADAPQPEPTLEARVVSANPGPRAEDSEAREPSTPAALPARRTALADLAAPPGATPEAIPAPTPAEPAGAPTAVVAEPWRDLLAGYRTAYERLDARLAKQVWPAVDERALARAFDALESQAVVFDACDVAGTANRAVATCRGSATYVTRMGHRSSHTESRRWTFQLERSAQRWVIESVEIR